MTAQSATSATFNATKPNKLAQFGLTSVDFKFDNGSWMLSGGCVEKGHSFPVPATASAAKNLGPCPKRPPVLSAKSNLGIEGLDKKLVPIVALDVRICEYLSYGDLSHGRLVASGVLDTSLATSIEDDTNGQQRRSVPPGHPTGPGGAVDYFFMTFANDARHVNLAGYGDPYGDDTLSNGTLTANPYMAWFKQLALHTTPQTEASVTP